MTSNSHFENWRIYYSIHLDNLYQLFVRRFKDLGFLSKETKEKFIHFIYTLSN